jgi:hypothetical protein
MLLWSMSVKIERKRGMLIKLMEIKAVISRRVEG